MNKICGNILITSMGCIVWGHHVVNKGQNANEFFKQVSDYPGDVSQIAVAWFADLR